MRSGDEPAHARSPLRLRLVLAALGVLCWSAGTAMFVVVDAPVLALACAVGAGLAMLNVIVVSRRVRAGAHWQPGRDVPPYRPLPPAPLPRKDWVRLRGIRRAPPPPPSAASTMAGPWRVTPPSRRS